VLVGGFAVGPFVADTRSELGLVEPLTELGQGRDRDRLPSALVLAVDLGAAVDLDPGADLVDSGLRE